MGMPMARPRYKAIIVSPHLDDAVFSCAGEIARLVEQGPVLVLNLFTRYLGEVKARAVVLGDERYEEEQAAARFLGFTSRNFNELDVSFRHPAYRSLGNIFRPPVQEDTEGYLPELRERVFAYLSAIDYESLYVPLGIGWHVDHILTYRLFEPWMGDERLIHYEDAPYCLFPHATRYRLDELGSFPADDENLNLPNAGNLQSWWATTRAYADTALMRNLRPAIVRWFAVPVVGIYLYRLMALHRRLAERIPGAWALSPRAEPLGVEFKRKLHAMTLYRSQFQEFFLDAADCERLYMAYAARTSRAKAPIERFWRIKAAS